MTRYPNNAALFFHPDIDVRFEETTNPTRSQSLYAAADIFALPVDNIQESFGLAPVESMAAGLPVVCSDWDGLRDTIEQDVTGLRVTTRLSRTGMGHGMAFRFEDGIDSHLQNLTFVQQRTVIDIPELSDCLLSLINNGDKRQRMGQAGRKRARQLYDWSVVAPRYAELWHELDTRRSHPGGANTRADFSASNLHPAFGDPFVRFREFASRTILPSTVIATSRPYGKTDIDNMLQLTGDLATGRLSTRVDDIIDVSELIFQQGPITLKDLVSR